MPSYISEVLPGIKYTVIVTVAAFAIGAGLGVPLALMRRSARRAPRALSASVVNLIRSIPPITWLFVIFYGLPSVRITLSAVPAAIVGLGVIAGAYLSEIYRSGLLAVSKGQWEASRALGFNDRDTLVHVIGPQASRVIGPSAATYAIGLLKDSAVASTIGVTEITFRANSAQTVSGHAIALFVTAGAIYLLLSLPLAVVSRNVDRRLRARYSLV
ncbi:MAG TPA: amino acid ABC transporter permease [Solirubrobacteraceae bacterium]|jgi:polar amino acid transport system permease protein|nr:amino acid ABC transporter permease [Solirubrobacteraceae bacterium]